MTSKSQRIRNLNNARHYAWLHDQLLLTKERASAWRRATRLCQRYMDETLSGHQWKRSREEILQAIAEAEQLDAQEKAGAEIHPRGTIN